MCELAAAALTPRERQVAKLLLCGLPDKAIANILEIAESTVSHNLRKIAYKAGFTERLDRVKLMLCLSGNLT